MEELARNLKEEEIDNLANVKKYRNAKWKHTNLKNGRKNFKLEKQKESTINTEMYSKNKNKKDGKPIILKII